MSKTIASALFSFILAVVLTISGSGQDDETDQEPPVRVPDLVMEQVVKRLVTWNFKPRKHPSVIFLSDSGIKSSWLPPIKNIEFRLVSVDAARERPKGVYSLDPRGIYFFAPLELQNRVYVLGFGRGDPQCEASGNAWYFHVSNGKVRLQPPGNFGSDCSHPSHAY